MTRRCSHCGHNGHNSRTCPERGVRLFGVRLADNGMRKSVSMGNLHNYSGSNMALPATPEHSDNGGAGLDGYTSDGSGPSSAGTRERKKGIPWTEEEHRMFLLGLHKLGKGDWRGISRNFVQTRTPTQVASHAQKYFIRQNNLNKRKRRSSLFDICTEGVGVGMGRSMSTPSLPTLSEDSTSPLHSQSSGSQNALYSPSANYDLNRSQSYPSGLPGTGGPQPAVPSYAMSPQMNGGPGPPGMHMMQRGSSGNLESLAERTSGPQGMEQRAAGMYMSSRGMGPPGLSTGMGLGLGMGMGMGLGMGMGMGMGMGYGGMSMPIGGSRGGMGMDLSMGPPRDGDHAMKEEHDDEASMNWKKKTEELEAEYSEKGGNASMVVRTDPAVSHRMGHEMMLRMSSQMMAQQMAEAKDRGHPEERIRGTRDVAMEGEQGQGQSYGRYMEEEDDRAERTAADREQERAPAPASGGWYWGHEGSAWALPFQGMIARGGEEEEAKDPPEARGAPQWPGSYSWGPHAFPGLGFFMGAGGPGPYNPYASFPWSAFGPSGPPPYGMPPGIGGPPLGLGLPPVNGGSASFSPPSQSRVLRPTASLPTCPSRLLEQGFGSSLANADKPGLGSSSLSEPSPLTLRLLESSSARQSAFQSRPAYDSSSLAPMQTSISRPPVSAVAET